MHSHIDPSVDSFQFITPSAAAAGHLLWLVDVAPPLPAKDPFAGSAVTEAAARAAIAFALRGRIRSVRVATGQDEVGGVLNVFCKVATL